MRYSPIICYYLDIDECVESNGECQHICKNEISTYQCLCHSGYLLGADKHSCEGNHRIMTKLFISICRYQ